MPARTSSVGKAYGKYNSLRLLDQDWGVFLKIYKTMELHANAIKGVNEDGKSVDNTLIAKVAKISKMSPLESWSNQPPDLRTSV